VGFDRASRPNGFDPPTWEGWEVEKSVVNGWAIQIDFCSSGIPAAHVSFMAWSWSIHSSLHSAFHPQMWSHELVTSIISRWKYSHLLSTHVTLLPTWFPLRGRPVNHPLHLPVSRINATSTARIASLSSLLPSPFVANRTHQLRYRVCLLLELVRCGFSFIGFLLDFFNWRKAVRDVTFAQHQEPAPIMRSGQELEGGLLQIAALYFSTEVSCHVEVGRCGSFSSSSST
jgi:hypothetical protein